MNATFTTNLPRFLSIAALAASLGACAVDTADIGTGDEADLTEPGNAATDARKPELGSNPAVAKQSKIKMADAIKQATKANGPIIEAKFELDDNKNLSLSLYPVGKGLKMDAERNVFQELAGDPRKSPFAGKLETFTDFEHLTRSARDLTLVQLSQLGVADAVGRMPYGSFVYWAIPTVRDGRAGYGVYYLTPSNLSKYKFVDGLGSDESNWDYPEDLGAGPGKAASDARTPELGDNPAVVRKSHISMSAALAQAEKKNGATIEAKFEIGDDGKLSLSVYPVGKGLKMDAERNQFFELAGDPTTTSWKPALSEFKVPDAEHLTRSAHDLTLVQTANLSLREAVAVAEEQIDGGVVYWAIPTIHGTQSGYGVYVLDGQNKTHYFFIS